MIKTQVGMEAQHHSVLKGQCYADTFRRRGILLAPVLA